MRLSEARRRQAADLRQDEALKHARKQCMESGECDSYGTALRTTKTECL